ncbi:hypothetical protein [Arthrobacter roseus]|uniref:hypothetical protein n=1 Tax=Arthrobacter roseus TaxID=136274 RepID=UPI0019659C42|nr:hypothetical protein [Arthrobacter roseus]MBM7847614.1 hypothetical protein [Arthrobacter roseus]
MTATHVELGDGEQLMSSESEVVFRQVTQHMFDGDLIATTAFGPSTADRDMPSYSRSTVVTAQDSRDWHTQNAKSPSLGVWGITVGEVIDSGRYVVDDSQCSLDDGQKRAPGHCFVDFRELSKPQKRELRAQLYFYAIARGELPTMATTPDGQLFA